MISELLKRPDLKPYFTVMLLLIVSSFALAFTINISITDEAGVRTVFPEKAGDWTGYEVRFCQNPGCRSDFMLKDLVDPDACPKCESELREASIAELDILPSDTVLHKKRYFHPSGRSVYASLVLSGKDRASIHRPEVCLVGQGNEVIDRPIIDIPLQGRDPLGVRVMEMLRHVKGPSGDTIDIPSYYTYWFVGKDRETASHIQRMVYMATDRLFRNVAHRWAYIAVSGQRDLPDNGHYEEIGDFLSDFYPAITLIKQ